VKIKDKNLEDHFKDIQEEYRNGDHLLEWMNNEESGLISSVDFVSENTRIRFCFWNEDCENSGSILDFNIRGGDLESRPSVFYQIKKRSNNEEADKIYCQNWFLEFLAKERFTYENVSSKKELL